MAKTPAEILFGNPQTRGHQVNKRDLLALFLYLESLIGSGGGGGGADYSDDIAFLTAEITRLRDLVQNEALAASLHAEIVAGDAENEAALVYEITSRHEQYTEINSRLIGLAAEDADVRADLTTYIGQQIASISAQLAAEDADIRVDVGIADTALGLRIDDVSNRQLVAPGRPGELPSLFSGQIYGSAVNLVPLSIGTKVVNAEGAALRFTNTTADPIYVAPREDYDLAAGQVYGVRYLLRRHANSSDPAGDAVVMGIVWLDASKNPIGTAWSDQRTLVVADGFREVLKTISRDEEADVTAPSGARYFRPYVEIFGAGHQTDVNVVRAWQSGGLIGPRGPVGDVTPALAALRNDSVVAAAASEAARDLTISARDTAVESAASARTSEVEADAARGVTLQAKVDVLAALATGETAPALAVRTNALEAMQSQRVFQIEDWSSVTIDQSGRPTTGRKTDGSRWIAVNGQLVRDLDPTVALEGVVGPKVSDWAEVTVDATNRPVSGWTIEGLQYRAVAGVLKLVVGGAPVNTFAIPAYDFKVTTGTALRASGADIDYLILVIGQSWAEGASFDSDDTTVTTVAQHPGAALMFDVGTNPDGRAVSSYVDLKEAPYSTLSKETVCSGMADVIMQKLQTDMGRKPRMIFAVAARGGTAYYGGTIAADEGIKRGSSSYMEGLRLVKRASEISAAAGRKLEVLAVMLHHGEQDHSNGLPKGLYGRALDQFQMHLNADIKAITKQDEPVRLYAAQANRTIANTIGPAAQTALAVMAAEDRNPMIRCVGPAYQSPPSNDHAHLKARGFRWLGCLDGQVIVDDLFGPYQRCLRVVEAYWQTSTSIRLKFTKPLALETTDALIKISTLGPGRGVNFLDGSLTPPTVTGIAIVSGQTDTLEVTLSAAPTGLRPRVFIASFTTEGGSGSTEGARSAIRSATAFFTDALTSTALYWWAAHEELSLPPL
jgi:hypothetical protein